MAKRTSKKAIAALVRSDRSSAAARPNPAKAAPVPASRKVMTVREFASAWGVTETHIANLIDQGALLAIDLAGGATYGRKRSAWRIPIESWAKFVAGRNSLAAVL